MDPTKPLSPETYFGAWRNELLANGKSGVEGVQNFEEPELGGLSTIRTSALYLVGSWDMKREYAANVASGSRILYRYQGKNVYMVLNHDTEVSVRVLRDGVPLIEDAGADVVNGVLRVVDDGLYHIVGDDDYGEHTLEFIIEGPGLQAFTFTFG